MKLSAVSEGKKGLKQPKAQPKDGLPHNNKVWQNEEHQGAAHQKHWYQTYAKKAKPYRWPLKTGPSPEGYEEHIMREYVEIELALHNLLAESGDELTPDKWLKMVNHFVDLAKYAAMREGKDQIKYRDALLNIMHANPNRVVDWVMKTKTIDDMAGKINDWKARKLWKV